MSKVQITGQFVWRGDGMVWFVGQTQGGLPINQPIQDTLENFGIEIGSMPLSRGVGEDGRYNRSGTVVTFSLETLEPEKEKRRSIHDMFPESKEIQMPDDYYLHETSGRWTNS
ncbi:MAG: hypothetical protein Q8Q94_03965 [bacterium]|nr:hypothetical protein [bacterium]MDZ4299755.1 hypothetical protein [Candidatus Sungbacteria bacterium]